jgi:hypothetical protein
MAGGHVNLTATKGQNQSAALALSAKQTGVGLEAGGILDGAGNPLYPGKKVDMYKWKSFYLEADSSHFDDFFARVVDPTWLANNSSAAALRAAKTRRNSVWRVVHRVDFISRPYN